MAYDKEGFERRRHSILSDPRYPDSLRGWLLRLSREQLTEEVPIIPEEQHCLDAEKAAEQRYKGGGM